MYAWLQTSLITQLVLVLYRNSNNTNTVHVVFTISLMVKTSVQEKR